MLTILTKEETEKTNEVLKVLFKISLIIGGLATMSYCNLIDFFPYDLSIGDGVLFIGIALSFGILYILLTTLFSCAGFKLRGVLLVLVKLLFRFRGDEKQKEELISMIPNKTEKILWVPATFGFLIIIKISSGETMFERFTSLIVLIFLSWLSAHCISSYWELKKEAASNLEVSRKSSARLKSIYLLVFLTFPLLTGEVMSTMLMGAMRLVKIRQEHVTVHVSNPYAQFAIEAGAKGEVSAMGKEYLKFENVDVLFTGPGKNSVLQFNKSTSKLIIPTEKLFIPY